MGFFTGRVSFLRYRIDRAAPKMFGPDHLEKLAAHAPGKQRLQSKDGVEAGWIAGDDILDTDFDLAKNIVNDAMHFALRLDVQRLPGDLLRAYTRIELKALSAGNPSGRPSLKQKKQAREAARERLEVEARDGRYLRRKAYPILYDRPSNTLLVGATSGSVLDHVQKLFKDTFGGSLTLVDAGQRAIDAGPARAVADARPSEFIAGGGEGDVAWALDPANPRYLGNEFLLWLWFVLDFEDDVIPLGDKSDVSIMLARTLVLDCPRAQSGRASIHSDAPTRLPEAARAIQSGKLPRQAGMILVRHGQQMECTLQAETLAVSGAKLPALEEEDERALLEERVGQIRHLIETIDLLYDTFLQRRLSTNWPKDVKRLQRWLKGDDRSRAATA
jgi:hypothetical protein